MNRTQMEELVEQARRRVQAKQQEEDEYGDPMIKAYLEAGGCEAGWKSMERVKRQMERGRNPSTPYLKAGCKDKRFEKILNIIEHEMIRAWQKYGGSGDLAWQAMERAKRHALKRLGLEKPRHR